MFEIPDFTHQGGQNKIWHYERDSCDPEVW